MSIIDAISQRRSIYSLNKNLPVSDSEVEALIKKVTELVPDAFNMKSARVVLALGEKHNALWDTIYDAFGGKVSREKITILEALAQAGDLTIHGVRTNVKLIREDAKGQKSITELNLNDANLINSPYYYLQQNDVVYVTPNKVKAQNSSVGSMTTLWFSATSILISLTSLLYNILK